jgi:hypothetical protein
MVQNTQAIESVKPAMMGSLYEDKLVGATAGRMVKILVAPTKETTLTLLPWIITVSTFSKLRGSNHTGLERLNRFIGS